MGSPDVALQPNEPAPDVSHDNSEKSIPVTAYKSPEALDGLTIDDCVFADFQDYSGVTFNGPVDLRNVRFEKGFSFAGATFLKSFRMTRVWNDRAAGSKADFETTKFFGTFSVRQNSALYCANFLGASFLSSANFASTRFYATAKFSEAKFRTTSSFKQAMFHGAGDFRSTVFSDEADFEDAVFCYEHSDARFAEAEFDGPAIFTRAHFSGDADFKDAAFRRGASFYGARFNLRRNAGGPRPTSDDVIDDDASGSEPKIQFDGALFEPELGDAEVATFENAKFGDGIQCRSVSFERAQFRSWGADKAQPVTVNFKSIICTGPVSFCQAQFNDNVAADFSNADFERELDLDDCLLLGEVNFQRAHFKSEIFVAATRFARYPDLRQAKLTVEPTLSDAALPSGKQPLAKYDTLSRISALRKIAGRGDDKRAEAELHLRELKLGGGAASRAYGVIANYGQSWLRPAGWLLVLALLVFPPLYLANSAALPLTREGWATAFKTRTMPCRNAVAGNAIAAALDISIKNALIVASENTARDARIDTCLGNGTSEGLQGLGYTLIEAAQKILTLILVFFIGASIRRRLLIR